MTKPKFNWVRSMGSSTIPAMVRRNIYIKQPGRAAVETERRDRKRFMASQAALAKLPEALSSRQFGRAQLRAIHKELRGLRKEHARQTRVTGGSAVVS